jgi:hypothetical protein
MTAIGVGSGVAAGVMLAAGTRGICVATSVGVRNWSGEAVGIVCVTHEETTSRASVSPQHATARWVCLGLAVRFVSVLLGSPAARNC